jgi:hypothetical protein
VGVEARLPFRVVVNIDRLEVDVVLRKELFRAQAAGSARLVVKLYVRHEGSLRGFS